MRVSSFQDFILDATDGLARFVTLSSGDLDGDGTLSAADIDVLSAAARDGVQDAPFDLNGDGAVNGIDRQVWVTDIVGTFFGDADLDQEVALADFMSLSKSFSAPGGWAAGDFDGSGNVQFADFLLLSANFGKSATAVAAVPEPNAAMLLLVGLVGFVQSRWIVSESRRP